MGRTTVPVFVRAAEQAFEPHPRGGHNSIRTDDLCMGRSCLQRFFTVFLKIGCLHENLQKMILLKII
jgi:hypothetical protein